MILMFGQDYSPDAKEITLHKKDGSEVHFYLPTQCRFTKLPNVKEAMRAVKPEELDPENAYALGRRFEEERSMKEAIACYTSAYQRGLFQAFEALTDLAQNEYDREYPCAGRIWLRRIPQRSQGGGEGICKCDEGLPPILQSDRVRHLLQGF